jgi:hypothetical protein
MILSYAGYNKTGFVKYRELIFRSEGNQVISDYHLKIHVEILKTGFQITSLIIYNRGQYIRWNDASYDSVVFNKFPSAH